MADYITVGDLVVRVPNWVMDNEVELFRDYIRRIIAWQRSRPNTIKQSFHDLYASMEQVIREEIERNRQDTVETVDFEGEE